MKVCNNDSNIDHTERRDLRFLQSPHCTVKCIQYVEVTRAQSCVTHMQHIERLSCAKYHVPNGMKAQLSY